ncbi:MAG TPA: helix-turn-helix domain-containing protein [Candidatus Limnocylindrales bacterium]
MSTIKSEQTRDRVLDAANALMLDRGYHGVGMAAVASAAGVTRQTLYDQFGSKAGLLRAMVTRSEEVAGLPRLLERARTETDGLAMLRAMLDAVAAVEPQLYPISRLVHAARLEDPVAAELWAWRMGSRLAGMRGVMARLAADGLLAPGVSVGEAADVAWALTSPQQYEFLVITQGWDVQLYRAHLERTITARLLRVA